MPDENSRTCGRCARTLTESEFRSKTNRLLRQCQRCRDRQAERDRRSKKRPAVEELDPNAQLPAPKRLRQLAPALRSSLDSLPAVTLPSANPPPRPLKATKRTAEDIRVSEAVKLAVGLVEDEFQLREIASQEFPPEISTSHVRSSISKFEDEMSTASQKSICCSCGSFVPREDIHKIGDHDHRIQQILLDQCGHHDSSWDFCTLCYTAVTHRTIPKFSAANFVNVTMCQHYPAALKDLTAVEECIIAKCHPLGIILKLRPAGHSSPTNYNALRGHMILIPQDPGPLLQILPSPELRLDNLIKVFWLGKYPPTNRDLKPFLQVRKDKVLAALQYLVEHNHLYHDLSINHTTIEGWSDDFIPPEIADNITCLDNADHHEREGYTVSLQSGNYENDFHAAQGGAFQADEHDPFITGSIYTDINGERTNPDIRIIDALLGVVTETSSPAHGTTEAAEEPLHMRRDVPTISYSIRGQSILVNSWEDAHYFTGAFPTLFPSGVGGHQDPRPAAVSLAAFAKWALNHHSRRFARHKTFMYLLYDVLQLRQSSLGHRLLVQRQNWRSTKDDIASLTGEQLRDAAKAVANGQIVDNPIIHRLLRDLRTIGMRVPQSFSQKLNMRSEIKGLIARYGMPAFWMTINPSDLRNPLVLRLAGLECPQDSFPMAEAAIRHATATSNPVAVAQFFNHTCKGIFDGLLLSHTGQMGILGQVANHFGVVETNGRGMLHLHALIWVTGNVEFSSLRDRLLEDSHYANKMIRYLESIIVQSIDSYMDDSTVIGPANIAPSSKGQESDDEFHMKLATDSNAVARKTQVHSSNHNATCFKYHQKGLGKDTCRFGMPRDLVSHSQVDELGVIHLARNHGWVNPWNPAIASCIRSNHDISWIPTVSKCLSLIFYLTNYATKDDVSPYQMLVKAALLKQSIDKAKATLTPDATDLRLRKKDTDQFALRCFNSLSHDREISGVHIASSLLQLPTYYTKNYNFVQVNLWWLRRYVRIAIESIESLSHSSSESIGEEHCTVQPEDTAPVSRFDNYKWRGPYLAHLALFEYCMLVQTKKRNDARASDVEFEHKHPRSRTHVQRLACSPSQVMTVHFNGQLSEFQADEESIRGGHPTTEAIKNDLAEVLLGFFVPWNQLPSLFQRHASEYETKRDACSKIWNIVEPTLSPHNRNFAQNFDLLRKSREDVRIDAALRASLDSFDQDIDDIDPANINLDTEDTLSPLPQEFTTETLITAFHSIVTSWHKEGLAAGKHIPCLLSGSNQVRRLQLQSLLPLDIFRLPTYATSGLTFFPRATLQQWESQIKGLTRLDDMEAEERIAFEVDDFDFDLGDGALRPTLNLVETIPNLADRRSQVGNNPSGKTLTTLVNEDLPLNRKQRLVVERVLSGAIAWRGHAYDASKREQMLLFVGGEGGVGKSRVIKAVVAGMDLIHRKDEIIRMAPTGAAATNIGGNTYHTASGISLAKKQKPTVSPRVRKLWSNKTIMIIDEISMTDLSMLNTINNQCKIAKSLDRNSPDLFGGLPVVIFMGDFYQFPPVRGPALWKEPRKGNDEDANGLHIWHRFTNVIILDQQMRQAEDPIFRDLLRRARAADCTEGDLALLNQKVAKSLFTPELEDATIVVKSNNLRHHINRIQMEHFARSRSQRIYIFPAQHSRVASTSSSPLCLDDLLQVMDKGAAIPFPGLFFYTLGMPAMILANICTLLGHVNGARGFVSGIVVEPTAEFFEMDDLYILCTKPPACVLFQQENSKHPTFEDLDVKVVPVFPIERSIKIKEYYVRRKQVPICPAFSLTDYKVQSSTLTTAVLDLKDDPTKKGQDEHRKFCSGYVQLSRLQSLHGVHLLQKIDMKDLRFRPHNLLLAEMERLRKLEDETIASWAKQECLDSALLSNDT